MRFCMPFVLRHGISGLCARKASKGRRSHLACQACCRIQVPPCTHIPSVGQARSVWCQQVLTVAHVADESGNGLRKRFTSRDGGGRPGAFTLAALAAALHATNPHRSWPLRRYPRPDSATHRQAPWAKPITVASTMRPRRSLLHRTRHAKSPCCRRSAARRCCWPSRIRFGRRSRCCLR